MGLYTYRVCNLCGAVRPESKPAHTCIPIPMTYTSYDPVTKQRTEVHLA